MSLRLKICLVIGQLAVHGSQLRLELFNLPVQTANRSEHGVLLVPIVQEQVVTSEISDVSLQISNSTFQIVSLMLESHPLQQRLLVLFQVLTLAKPPVTNYSQSTPRKEKRKNRGKYYKATITKYNTTNPYRRHTTAKKTDSKLKKKAKSGQPPHRFTRTVPTDIEPEKKENMYSPAVHPTTVTK